MLAKTGRWDRRTALDRRLTAMTATECIRPEGDAQSERAKRTIRECLHYPSPVQAEAKKIAGVKESADGCWAPAVMVKITNYAICTLIVLLQALGMFSS